MELASTTVPDGRSNNFPFSTMASASNHINQEFIPKKKINELNANSLNKINRLK